MKKKVAVLISGRGSNLGELIAACQGADYPAEIVLVISNNDDAGGLQRAAEAGIATQFIPHHGKSRETFDRDVDAALRAAGAEIVCLAGFMRILSDEFVRAWEGKLINIHPSLLPAYRGTKVHERVLAAREAQSGASVHFVVPELDAGPVIAQASVPVHPDDTPEALAERILQVEHQLYPAALRLLAEDGVRLQNGLAIFQGTKSIGRYVLSKMALSAGRRHRVLFWRREDGLIQYSEEYLRDDEDQGQKYSLWASIHSPSGLFPDLTLAEAEARNEIAWFGQEH